MCPLMRANTENSSTGGLLPPVDFIYIASLLNRHGISCNPCHAVKARHCLVCHAAPRVMVPDSRGCGSVRVKRRNTPCLGDCQENTTLSGGGQPPSPRKSSGLVDDCRLRPVCYAYPLVKVALSRDIDRRIVYRIVFRYLLSDSGTAYSGMPSDIGTCFGCRVSAAGYLPRKSENNQLRGISGLVSRLYLGFYIPRADLSIRMTKKYVTHLTSHKAGLVCQ